MIETFTEKGIKEPYPKEIFKNIFYKNFHKIHRKYDLKDMKNCGITKVKIEDCGDDRDCNAVKRLKKIWAINEVPELPLPQCKADYCRCCYIAADFD
jgi:hypothetical protein